MGNQSRRRIRRKKRKMNLSRRRIRRKKKKDAEHREQQLNVVVIDGNGDAVLVNTDGTPFPNFEVDGRTGQTIPQPVMLAALQVVRAGAHLAPYAAVPVAIVGGTLAAKAILAKKID